MFYQSTKVTLGNLSDVKPKPLDGLEPERSTATNTDQLNTLTNFIQLCSSFSVKLTR